MVNSNNRKWWIGFALFVCVGTYNAFVINTKSYISNQDQAISSLNQFDGIVHPGRVLATNSSWKKLSPEEVKQSQKQFVLTDTVPTQIAEAAIKEDLKLDLIEVSNPQKYKDGLSRNDFDGNLATSDGVLESFTVSLPSGEEISVAYIEMSGNVFNYDLEGEVYSAMIFQADQTSYLVTFTNGPLEGTRLRFSGQPTAEQVVVQQTLSEEHNIEVGTFGVETIPAEKNAALEPEANLPLQVQVFNFDQQVL